VVYNERDFDRPEFPTPRETPELSKEEAMRRHLLLALLGILIASPLLAAGVNDPSLVVSTVITSGGGLSSPTGFAFIASNDILALEKNAGTVRRIQGGVLQAGAVLDLHVNFASERGLLGIALHPDFATNHYVYLYWSEASIGADTAVESQVIANRVTRYTWNGTALVGAVQVLRLPVLPGPNHDAGYLLFGPDGKLYVQTGDLNRNGKLQNFPSGPLPDSTSVIFRLNADGSVPPDNPFVSLGAPMSAFYAYGIRNSFGMVFDPVSGILWQSENGPSSYDELNAVGPGWNSGWEQIMGPDSRDPQGVGDLWSASPAAFYSDPEFSWSATVCVTGVAFPSTAALGASYSDALFVGECNSGRIFRFRLNPARDALVFTNPGLLDLVGDSDAEMAELMWGSGFGTITCMKTGPDGALYVLSYSGLYRIVNPILSNDGAPPPPAAVLTSAPNPFSARTMLRAMTARSGPVTLDLFGASGRLIRVLHEGPLPAGMHAFEWDGRDEEGRPLPAGVYLARLSGPGGVWTHRTIRLR
jgi:glucose/arabinose dehydrogenase